MFLDDVLADRQAEAGAFFLGRVKGFEDVLEVFGLDPAAGVLNSNQQTAVSFRQLSGDGQCPAVRHGVYCVHKEIQKDLF